MEDRNIKGALFFDPEEKGLKEIKINEIRKRLSFLKEHLAESNNYRCSWDDFDVAVICWLLAHDPEELEFWKKTTF